jgi:hypothetical protein
MAKEGMFKVGVYVTMLALALLCLVVIVTVSEIG